MVITCSCMSLYYRVGGADVTFFTGQKYGTIYAMEKDESLSKDGAYDVYHTDDGQNLVVLNGLNVEDRYEAPYLQQKIHEHYNIVASFYWVLLAGVLVYVVATKICMPLLKKRAKA